MPKDKESLDDTDFTEEFDKEADEEEEELARIKKINELEKNPYNGQEYDVTKDPWKPDPRINNEPI